MQADLRSSAGLLRLGRVFAVASVGLFVLVLVLGGGMRQLLSNEGWTATVTLAFAVFLLGVIAYGASFAYRMASPARESDFVRGGEGPTEGDNLRASYATAQRVVASAELFFWISMIAAFFSFFLGIHFPTPGAVLGAAVGAVFVVAPSWFLLRSSLHLVKLRRQIWVQRGRRKWQFLAFLAVAAIFTVVAGLSGAVIRTNVLGTATSVLLIILLIRIGLMLGKLW